MFYTSPLTLYKIAILLFLSSFILCYLLTSTAIRIAFKINLLDEPTSKRKIHSLPTPLLGGVAVFLSFLLILCFFFLIIQYFILTMGPHYFIFGSNKIFWIKIGLYLICSILIVFIGLLDDVKNINFKSKLFVQSLAALIMMLSGMTCQISPWPIFNFFVTFIWILCLTNAFNLLDNMNGLSTGLAIIVIIFFVISSYINQNYLFSLLFIILLGCLIGFFPHNFPKANIFLGDAGSLFIGFSLAVFSVWIFNQLLEQRSSFWIPLWTLLLILSIPICDTLTVVAIRIKNKKPFYIGDTNHLSHQLVKLGLSSTNAVLMLYGSALILGVIGLLYTF